MMSKIHCLTLFVALLLLSGIAHAADADGTMQKMCERLLSVQCAASQAPAQAPVVEDIGPDLANFTFSRQHDDANASLSEANGSIERMRAAGLPLAQVSDLLLLAQEWFSGQSALELAGESPDYRFTFQKVLEIKQIERSAFSVSDELKALLARMGQSAPGVNLSEAKTLQEEASKEFADGRYSEAQKQIDLAYEKVELAEAQFVHENTMLESTRKTLENFLKDNWQWMLSALALVGAALFLFQKQIRRAILRSRIKSLIIEKKTLEGMMVATQKGFFKEGSVNETAYDVRMKKYKDLVLNINRQLPLLKEELKKI
jgi:hypothetical protein